MKVIIEKEENGLEIASCEYVNGGKQQTQYLREDYVYIRVHDGAVMIGAAKGLHPPATDREVAMAHAFKSVKALCPVVKDAA